MQQINGDRDQCAFNQPGTNTTISALNLTTGVYAPLCFIDGVCLNACSISPVDSFVYCQQLNPRQLVRVDCPLDVTTLPPPQVNGKLCYFGDIEPSFAASFDLETGNFYYRNGDKLFELLSGDIQAFQGSTTPQTGSQDNQVENAENELISSGFPSIADFIVTTLDIGSGPEKVVAGCNGNEAGGLNRRLSFALSSNTYSSHIPEGMTPAARASGSRLLLGFKV